MKQRRSRQQLGQQPDISNPDVRAWLAEFGTLEHAVSVRLVGVVESDLRMQIDRLERAFGTTIAMTTPRRGENGTAWVAYGTITS